MRRTICLLTLELDQLGAAVFQSRRAEWNKHCMLMPPTRSIQQQARRTTSYLSLVTALNGIHRLTDKLPLAGGIDVDRAGVRCENQLLLVSNSHFDTLRIHTRVHLDRREVLSSDKRRDHRVCTARGSTMDQHRGYRMVESQNYRSARPQMVLMRNDTVHPQSQLRRRHAGDAGGPGPWRYRCGLDTNFQSSVASGHRTAPACSHI